MTFVRNNLGINVNANGEGCNMVDYDNDGDLDIYVNVNGAVNQLWENDLDTNNFLKVRILRCLDGVLYRDEIGAQVVVKDTDNVVIAPLLDLGTSKGHGSQNPHTMPVALPYNPCLPVNIEVTWTNVGGVVETLDTTIIPCLQPNNTLILSSGTGILSGSCNSILPVEFVSFTGIHHAGVNQLSWITQNESNNHHFKIESSANGTDFFPIGSVEAKRYPKAKNEYHFTDLEPMSNVTYYRLKQVDQNGYSTYSETIVLTSSQEDHIIVYPSSLGAYETLNIKLETQTSKEIEISLCNTIGQIALSKKVAVQNGTNDLALQLPDLRPGIYLVTIKGPDISTTRKVMIK